MLNLTKSLSGIIDESLKTKNINGSNSFMNLINEFADNFTDFNSSSELNKYATQEQFSNKDLIKIGGGNFMEFEASISMLDPNPKRIKK